MGYESLLSVEATFSPICVIALLMERCTLCATIGRADLGILHPEYCQKSGHAVAVVTREELVAVSDQVYSQASPTFSRE